MTPFVWMFISSYEELRLQLINNDTIISLIQLEYSGFDGATVPICTFTLQKNHIPNFSGSYIRLSDFRGAANQGPRTLEAINNKDCSWRYQTNQESFKKIPGSPIAFWIKHQERNLYQTGEILGDIASPKKGLDTGENEVFLRLWHEVSLSKSCYDNSDHNKKWYPYNKGGEFRKWYGNRDYLINWENNGEEIKSRSLWVKKKPTIRNQQYYFKPGMTWTTVSSGGFSARYCPEGALFDNGGCTLFTDKNIDILGAFLNSCIAARYLEFLSPTLNFQPGDIGRILFPKILLSAKIEFEKCVEIAKKDWNLYETSWDFLKSPLITLFEKKIQDTFVAYKDNCEQMSINLKKLEEHNNAEFDSYLLLNCNYNVELEKISLFSNVRYRYKDMQEKNECHNRFRSESLTDLLSYIVGCQMGRYSLDREGLVYAHEGNKGFADLVAEGAYKTFPADSDGILPLMDDEWFDDDVTSRVKEFVRTVWGEEHLQENLEFIAESLCLYAIKPKKGESALETIRRYLSTQFWKDHMKMYKKRPIYWLFSSGKEKAFECLVYLHRYNDATLSRMRTEYVVPLLARYQANIDRLSDQLDEASGGEATHLKRERDSLIKKFSELRSYDDRLRHYADMRISIDLDDGVKVNYGKFGDLLADVKAITGNAPKVI